MTNKKAIGVAAQIGKSISRCPPLDSAWRYQAAKEARP